MGKQCMVFSPWKFTSAQDKIVENKYQIQMKIVNERQKAFN